MKAVTWASRTQCNLERWTPANLGLVSSECFLTLNHGSKYKNQSHTSSDERVPCTGFFCGELSNTHLMAYAIKRDNFRVVHLSRIAASVWGAHLTLFSIFSGVLSNCGLAALKENSRLPLQF